MLLACLLILFITYGIECSPSTLFSHISSLHYPPSFRFHVWCDPMIFCLLSSLFCPLSFSLSLTTTRPRPFLSSSPLHNTHTLQNLPVPPSPPLPIHTLTESTEPYLKTPTPCTLKMSKGDVRTKKGAYLEKLEKLLSDHASIFLVDVDHVGSNQMHQIRQSLRGKTYTIHTKERAEKEVRSDTSFVRTWIMYSQSKIVQTNKHSHVVYRRRTSSHGKKHHGP